MPFRIIPRLRNTEPGYPLNFRPREDQSREDYKSKAPAPQAARQNRTTTRRAYERRSIVEFDVQVGAATARSGRTAPPASLVRA